MSLLVLILLSATALGSSANEYVCSDLINVLTSVSSKVIDARESLLSNIEVMKREEHPADTPLNREYTCPSRTDLIDAERNLQDVHRSATPRCALKNEDLEAYVNMFNERRFRLRYFVTINDWINQANMMNEIINTANVHISQLKSVR